MRVVVLGGTRFIGRRITETLVAREDEVMVVHRGQAEPADWVECRHLHTGRAEFGGAAQAVRDFGPDAIVDTNAMSRADADAVLPHLPEVPIAALSSMDVYRAYELLLAGQEDEPVPVTEESRLRAGRYPYRGRPQGSEDYEKLDVEPAYARRGAVVLRLAMIYGEHDPQRREEFILRRVRAGRQDIPVGPGTWLWTRCYVGDVATAVLAAITNPAASGQVLNIGEPVTRSMLGWARQILAAAGHQARLVRVPDALLPADMWVTQGYPQHLLADSRTAMDLLGWRPADPEEAISRSVRWHLAHPPDGPEPGFAEDDRALSAAG